MMFIALDFADFSPIFCFGFMRRHIAYACGDECVGNSFVLTIRRNVRRDNFDYLLSFSHKSVLHEFGIVVYVADDFKLYISLVRQL